MSLPDLPVPDGTTTDDWCRNPMGRPGYRLFAISGWWLLRAGPAAEQGCFEAIQDAAASSASRRSDDSMMPRCMASRDASRSGMSTCTEILVPPSMEARCHWNTRSETMQEMVTLASSREVSSVGQSETRERIEASR